MSSVFVMQVSVMCCVFVWWWCMHADVVEVCAVIGETLRMQENIGVQEVVSVREVFFLYICWGAVGVWS